MTESSQMDENGWLRRFWARLLIGSVTFSLGLGATAFGLRSLALHYAPPGGDRIRYLVEHKDEFDVVVLGSSIINVGFRSQQFEKYLRERHGREVRSYAFAMGRLAGAELDFYVNRILALDMPKLKWLLIDVSLRQEPILLDKNYYTERELDWQTPRQFSIVASQLMARKEPLRERLQKLWPYSRHLAVNVLAIGRGLPALEGFDSRNQPTDWIAASSEDNTDPDRVEVKARATAKYRENPQEHEAMVRKLLERRRPSRGRDNTLAAVWRDAAAARGIEVAFIVGPLMNNAAFRAKVPGKPDLRIFDFNDPRAFRRLYELQYHYDPWHVTEPGARLFSRALADDLDAAMDEVERR